MRGGGSGMKRARVVADKEMTLEFQTREHYLMSCSPPRLIALELCNGSVGELLLEGQSDFPLLDGVLSLTDGPTARLIG